MDLRNKKNPAITAFKRHSYKIRNVKVQSNITGKNITGKHFRKKAEIALLTSDEIYFLNKTILWE